MVWTSLWIVFVALTGTSADIHSYTSHPQEHQNKKHETSQNGRVEDRSLRQKFDTIGDYSRKPENFVYPVNGASNLWHPKVSFPWDYYGSSNKARVIPTIKDDLPLNEHSNDEISKSLPKIYPSEEDSEETMDLDNALFAVDLGPESRNIFTPQISEECEELGICENSPDYPHEYVEALLAKLPKGKIVFNLDKETPETEPSSNKTLLLCKPESRVIYPDKVRTKTGKWVFVVNGRNNKVQGFRGTKCLNKGHRCNYLVSFSEGYDPICDQRYMDQPMWALNELGTMELVTTSMPSCCVCELLEKK